MKNSDKNPRFAFFGTPDRAVIALETLNKSGIKPALVVTQPDRPQGRKLALTPPPAKVWALKENVPVLQPENLNDGAFLDTLRKGGFDFFVVVAYGKIFSQNILDIPKYGCINLHASLLPHLRGSSPVETAVLTDDRNTGATVILMDNQMDHGPIILQEPATIPKWPLPADDLAKILVEKGGELLVRAMRGIMSGEIKPAEQNHSEATFTKKISKEDGAIDLAADPYKNFLKYNAYKGWPGIHFFVEHSGKKIRVNITEAAFENGAFVVKKVIPEGKKETTWQAFNQNLTSSSSSKADL